MSHFRVPLGARRRDRKLLFVLVLFVYLADREVRSLIIYLKLGLLTLYKVTADYLSVGARPFSGAFLLDTYLAKQD